MNTLAALVSQRLPPGSVSEGQWPYLIPLGLQHGLGPMLLWAIQQAGIEPDEESRWEPLVTSAREAAINYALLKNTRARVDAVLAQAGVPALWLKGIALAQTVYPLPRLRPMVDLDLLVPNEQRELALASARSLGFQPPEIDYAAEIGMHGEAQYHDHLMGGAAGAVCLELHYHLLGPDGRRLLPVEELTWFWDQTQALKHDGTGFGILKPEAHLLYLCAHALLQHGEASMRLLRYFDLHLLVTQAEPDWQVVVDRAIDLRWSFAVERALTLAVGYFDTPVPESVFVQLRERRSSDEDISRVTRLQAEVLRWENWKKVLVKLPPTERVRMVWVSLFPPRSFMRYLYSIEPGRPVFPYYVYRWLDAGGEVARSVRIRLVRVANRHT